MDQYIVQFSLLMTLAALVILYGALMIMAPGAIQSMGKQLDKPVLMTDTKIFPNRKLWGTLFIVVGVLLLMSYFT